MLELASLGAGVLHPRAVECGKENNIVIHVRSSFEDGEGTRVKEVDTMESSRAVTGVAMSENVFAMVGTHIRKNNASNGTKTYLMSHIDSGLDPINHWTRESQITVVDRAEPTP